MSKFTGYTVIAMLEKQPLATKSYSADNVYALNPLAAIISARPHFYEDSILKEFLHKDLVTYLVVDIGREKTYFYDNFLIALEMSL